MAAGEQPLVDESTVPMVFGADPSSTCVRPALFLHPRARHDGAPLPAPPGDPGSRPVYVRGVQAEFKGWASVPRRWREWVDRLRPRHEALWREVGILGGVLASTGRVRRRRHERSVIQLATFWCGSTSTFVFPWGEATLTLEDVAALVGLPLLGGPVRAPVSDQLEKDVAAIEVVRAVLNRSKKRKSAYGAWVKHFVERAPEKEAASAGGAARELAEHGAFLAMWLSLFVLPAPPFDVVRREVFPLAARLARGQRVALAPAVLASIYSDLSRLKRHLTLGDKKEPFLISAPMHILQLWVWEHFPQLCPEPAAGSPAPGDHDMPRAARWHEVANKLSSKHVHAVFMSPKEFKWSPYGSRRLFALPREVGGSWVRGQDIGTSEALLSFAQCLHACDLVGMNCVEQYNPHRVARQLGFDQDIPGTVPRASSDWKKAWDTYNIEAKTSAFIVPNHKPGVTVQYAGWWKPYSLACGAAVSNAAKIKECRDNVSLGKRKFEGVPTANSCKKPHVDAPNRRRPPHIPADVNMHTSQKSQSSASHAPIRRAAAVPGLVLRACPPHLRFRVMPANAATGMPEPASDAANDPFDHIPLSERLNSITKMPKQHIAECLVNGGEQEQIAQSLKSLIPTSPNVGAKKAVLHKATGPALSTTVVSSTIVVDESSCRSVTKKAEAKCIQQSREEDHNIANEENNSRTEHCDVPLLNAVKGAENTGSNEAIGAGTMVDMLPTCEDLLVTSDGDECDKLSRKKCEVSAVHLKSHTLETKTSIIGEQNKDISAGNGEQGSQVLNNVSTQENFGNIVKISDDEIDDETIKEGVVFNEVICNEDALVTPKTEATWTILREGNEENKLISKINDEQDILAREEVMVPNSCDRELSSVLKHNTLRQEPGVLVHACTVQTDDVPLQGPIEKMHACIVSGEIDNIKVFNENFGSLKLSEKGNEDILGPNQELGSPMEDSAGASRKKSGNCERSSGNPELVTSEVCTKTIYYLSRFDRMKDAWDKDANGTGLPKRAVGTMEMIKKASAIRQAEIAVLKKKMEKLKEEILALEAAEREVST
ncbi:hypothetical protein U9M48_009791 [Paspalum notatum var. saurae]|uniref:Aminotransferase-like plant mobile domain-containing protein n=1 Tax=Paspalum notatum var. saurae TaxID=547442 RepID=A0AAQ3WFI8_PASNO